MYQREDYTPHTHQQRLFFQFIEWYTEPNQFPERSAITRKCLSKGGQSMARRIPQWKIVLTGAFGTCLLLLTFSIFSAVAAPPRQQTKNISSVTTPSVQAPPTEDPTVTALNKEKLAQEVQQLHNQNFWSAWTNLATPISILAVFAGSIFTLIRYLTDRRDARDKEFKDREDERAKRAEERFQKVVEGLGSDQEGVKVGAAIMLRTFLQPGYEQFYRQVFNLVVANLRLRPVDPNTSASLDPNEYVPVDSLSQALITVFKEAFPLARDELLKHFSAFDSQSLDASAVRLDRAYLVGADLEQVWMKKASLHGTRLRDSKLRKADFQWADLGNAYLARADLQGAKLIETKLGGAIFAEANLSGADLHWADLQGAILWKSDCSRSHFRQADLSGTNLSEANLSGANLLGANLSKANLSGANLDGTKLFVADFDEDYLSKLRSWGQDPIDAKLEGTIMHDVRGLDSTRLAEYKRRGAITEGSSTPPQNSQMMSRSLSTPDEGDVDGVG